MSGPIRVLSERIMTRGFEPTVGRIMEQVRSVIFSSTLDRHGYFRFNKQFYANQVSCQSKR